MSGAVLVVDDEAAQLQALCDTLREQGFAATGCAAAAPALAALERTSFDLLLSDLTMPGGMDGIALLQAAQARDPNLIGIIMTGAGSIASAVEAMKAGAFDYILKPFKLSALLPVLARALAVRRLRLENAALERRVRERTAELEAVNRELEAFSYSVSHDLRAPLRAISGFAGRLTALVPAGRPEEERHALERITANAERMRQLIEDLLRFSRLARQPLATRVVDIAGLVRDCVEELRRDGGGRHVVVEIGELPDCLGDPTLLKQIFANLLSNAFKYSALQAEARIAVGARRDDGMAVYTVRDNGIGFDMQHAGKLFGVFQRLHNDPDFEGTGIGLSIVQRAVQRHGGRVWAESRPGDGATFHIALPSTLRQ